MTKKKKRHLETRRRRSMQVGSEVARSLMIRGARQTGLHHILHSGVGLAVFIVKRPDDLDVFTEAAHDLVASLNKQSFYEHRDEVVDFTDLPDCDVARLIERMVSRNLAFGVATSLDQIPPRIRNMACGIVHIDDVDARALRAGIVAVTKQTPTMELLEPLAGAGLTSLSYAVRRGVPLSLALAKIAKSLVPDNSKENLGEASNPPVTNGPTLYDLCGYGEVAEWGQRLKVDLAAYRAGSIDWTDVDCGALISGPPGTGKTLVAGAIANSCGIPIFAHSFASWQARGYLNDMLKAMRKAFSEAEKSAPSILFIDEVDAVGDRASFSGRNADYNTQVLNAFLELLDGHNRRTGVVVIGATNLPQKIDAAILRPGRLDRHFVIPLPNAESRAGILRYHLKDMSEGIDIHRIAEKLEGASGADIQQLVKDAKRVARVENRELRTTDLSAALPATIRLDDDFYWRICVHETGHALIAHLLGRRYGIELERLSASQELAKFMSPGRASLSYAPASFRDRGFYTTEIMINLGGIAAEQTCFETFGDGSGGAATSDLALATKFAVAMLVSVGYGKSLTFNAPMDDKSLAAALRRDPDLKRRVDRLLARCLTDARKLLARHQDLLLQIAEALRDQGEIGSEEFARLCKIGSTESFGDKRSWRTFRDRLHQAVTQIFKPKYFRSTNAMAMGLNSVRCKQRSKHIERSIN